MAGLIQGAAGELSPEVLQSKFQLPPNLQQAYERVVLAGMKVLFDKSTNDMVVEQIRAPGPIGEKLGRGVAGLVLTLYLESNQTMPPQVMIPAGCYLVAQAADFARKTEHVSVSNEDVAAGIQVMIETLMAKFGIDPTRVNAAAAQMQGGAAQPQGAAQ